MGQLGLGSLLGLGLLFVVLGIALSYGALVQTEVQEEFTANSLAYNITQDSLEGVENVSSKQPILATIAVAVIIIGLIIAGFAGYGMMRV